MDYKLFWTLTPKTLKPFFIADMNKFKRENDVYDSRNWQLGQYIKIAYGDILGSAFGKSKVDNYPKTPMFQSEKNNKLKEKELSEDEKNIERLKAKVFFQNLGDFVAIKK